MKSTRRTFLQASAIASALAAASCGDSGGNASVMPRRLPTVRRTVHVHLGHFPLLLSTLDSNLSVVVAGVTHKLLPHTADSRKRLLSHQQEASHYADGVRFSELGAQSFVVGIPSELGVIVPLLGAIHIPTRSHAALGDDVDPYVIVDPTAAAIYSVFHSPMVMSLDSDTAAKVADHITRVSAFGDVVSAIESVGRAVTPEQAAKGRAGWMAGIYTLDKSGQRVRRVDIDGKPMVGTNGEPLWAYIWEPDPAVANATLVAVTQVLERVHSDASLEGVKFLTSRGIGEAVSPSAAGLRNEEEKDFAFLFADQDRERYRRAFSVERERGSSSRFSLKVKNPNALGTMIGASFFDDTGAQLSSTVLGYVQATFYPSIAAIFGPSTGEFTVTMPPKTATVHLYSGAIAANRGDYGEIIDAKKAPAGATNKWEGSDALTGAIILSGILDFLMPVTMLGLGLGGETAKLLNEELFKELLEEVGVEILVDLGKSVVVDIVNAVDGQYSAAMWVDMLKDIGKGLFAAMTKFIAKGMATAIAAIIAAFASTAAAASAAEAAVPIAGWVLKAFELAQTGAQLLIQANHIFDGGLVMKSAVQPAHEVKLVVSPEAEQSAYFPPSATQYEATIALPSRLPISFKGDFDPRNPAVTLACPDPVPLYGTLDITVKLYNGAGEVVGEGRKQAPNETTLGKEQEVELEIEGRAVAIRPTTRLVHLRKLVPTPTGRSYVETAVGPVADEGAMSCSDAAKVCALLGISIGQVAGRIGYAFRTPMACKQGLAAQAHLVSVAGAIDAQGLACGVSGTFQVVLAKGAGQATVITESGTGQTLSVFPIDPRAPLPASFDPASALGTLRGKTLLRARHHPAGYVLALTEVGVETVDLAKSARLSAPADATLFVRRGGRAGQLSGAVSVAPIPGSLAYVVLEQGPMRVQAVDFQGGVFETWSTASQIALPLGAGKVLLDVDVDSARNVWVLSTVPNGTKPGNYMLDVYNRLGGLVVRFARVNAHSLAIDSFATVFTENAENAMGPGGYPEPTISLWAPQNTSS